MLLKFVYALWREIVVTIEIFFSSGDTEITAKQNRIVMILLQHRRVIMIPVTVMVMMMMMMMT